MKNNEQKNKRKSIGYLVFVIALTAILLVMSTYAWFSTQRDVTITGLTGKVNVAEGLEISLDGENWSQTIDLADANLTGTSGKTYNSYSDTANHVPGFLAPVSTTGKTFTTNNKGVQFYSGVATSKELKGAVAVDESNTTLQDYEAGYPGYYAFDIFLRNNTRGSNPDKLQLTSNSICQILQTDATSNTEATNAKFEATGIQNTVRVAFALYSGTADTTDTGTQVIAKTVTATDSTISNVAIWEPNANYHVAYTKSYFSRKTPQILITSDMATALKTLNGVDSGETAGTHLYTLEESGANSILRLGSQGIFNTYALKTTGDISNVYDHTNTTDMAKVELQNTLKTKIKFENAAATTPSSYDMDVPSDPAASVAARQLINAADSTDFQITANSTVRVRVYVWLEGQDIDCIANASHGNGINLNVGLEKQPTTTTSSSSN